MTMTMHQHWRQIGILFGSSFVLHFAWEMIQAPLYQDFIVSFWQHFRACLFATFPGDMLFTLVIFLCLATVHRTVWWLSYKESYQHPATWVLSIVIGALIATSFELWAIYLDHRWVYGAMPIIPVLGVGLTPFLQMIFLPLISLRLTSHFSS